jgi:hypothetical protein
LGGGNVSRAANLDMKKRPIDDAHERRDIRRSPGAADA